jgi:hypothetical protein
MTGRTSEKTEAMTRATSIADDLRLRRKQCATHDRAHSGVVLYPGRIPTGLVRLGHRILTCRDHRASTCPDYRRSYRRDDRSDKREDRGYDSRDLDRR